MKALLLLWVNSCSNGGIRCLADGIFLPSSRPSGQRLAIASHPGLKPHKCGVSDLGRSEGSNIALCSY